MPEGETPSAKALRQGSGALREQRVRLAWRKGGRAGSWVHRRGRAPRKEHHGRSGAGLQVTSKGALCSHLEPRTSWEASGETT